MKDTTSPSANGTPVDETSAGFSEVERAAMKERAQELKTAKRRSGRTDKAAAEAQAVLATIAEMPEPDRGLAERVHAVIMASAPDLAPKLWYGSPAYAKDGKVVVFYQSAEKYSTRYATLGFNEQANLDDGGMWPTSFAVTELNAEVEATIGALVEKAVS